MDRPDLRDRPAQLVARVLRVLQGQQVQPDLPDLPERMAVRVLREQMAPPVQLVVMALLAHSAPLAVRVSRVLEARPAQPVLGGQPDQLALMEQRA